MPDERLIPAFDFFAHVVRPWTTDLTTTLWIVAMGIFVAVPCALLGCFLVLRRKAMIGDAISHALLAGLAGAFLVSGSRGTVPMIAGALVAGLLTVGLIEVIRRQSRIKEDAAMAVVFTALFALGVVLITRFTEGVDLDAQCVLYGEIEYAWLRSQRVQGMAVIALAVAFGVVLFFKELKITSFDPACATAMGVPATLIHYLLMLAVSLAVVGGLEAVGAILVVTLLIAPAASAYLWTDSLKRMLLISAALGAVSSVLGYHLALWLDCSTAGAISVVLAGTFAVSLVGSPRYGLAMRGLRRWQLTVRIARENFLKAIYELAPEATGSVPVPALADKLRVLPAGLARTSRRLQRRGWVEPVDGGAVKLTPRGAGLAHRVVRAHRLWKRFLVDKMGIATDHVQPDAEQIEHLLTERFLDRLDDLLGHPDTDPDGQDIPRALDVLGEGSVMPLSQLRTGDVARVCGIRPGTGAARSTRIAELQLPLGVDVTIGPRGPGGQWTITLRDGSTREIAHALADAIEMELRTSYGSPLP